MILYSLCLCLCLSFNLPISLLSAYISLNFCLPSLSTRPNTLILFSILIHVHACHTMRGKAHKPSLFPPLTFILISANSIVSLLPQDVLRWGRSVRIEQLLYSLVVILRHHLCDEPDSSYCLYRRLYICTSSHKSAYLGSIHCCNCTLGLPLLSSCSQPERTAGSIRPGE